MGIFGVFLRATADHIISRIAVSLIFVVAVQGDCSLSLTLNVIVVQNLS